MYQIPVSFHSLERYIQCNIFTFAVGKTVPYCLYNLRSQCITLLHSTIPLWVNVDRVIDLVYGYM
jgi:hypothetical protein